MDCYVTREHCSVTGHGFKSNLPVRTKQFSFAESFFLRVCEIFYFQNAFQQVNEVKQINVPANFASIKYSQKYNKGINKYNHITLR